MKIHKIRFDLAFVIFIKCCAYLLRIQQPIIYSMKCHFCTVGSYGLNCAAHFICISLCSCEILNVKTQKTILLCGCFSRNDLWNRLILLSNIVTSKLEADRHCKRKRKREREIVFFLENKSIWSTFYWFHRERNGEPDFSINTHTHTRSSSSSSSSPWCIFYFKIIK